MIIFLIIVKYNHKIIILDLRDFREKKFFQNTNNIQNVRKNKNIVCNVLIHESNLPHLNYKDFLLSYLVVK